MEKIKWNKNKNLRRVRVGGVACWWLLGKKTFTEWWFYLILIGTVFWYFLLQKWKNWARRTIWDAWRLLGASCVCTQPACVRRAGCASLGVTVWSMVMVPQMLGSSLAGSPTVTVQLQLPPWAPGCTSLLRGDLWRYSGPRVSALLLCWCLSLLGPEHTLAMSLSSLGPERLRTRVLSWVWPWWQGHCGRRVLSKLLALVDVVEILTLTGRSASVWRLAQFASQTIVWSAKPYKAKGFGVPLGWVTSSCLSGNRFPGMPSYIGSLSNVSRGEGCLSSLGQSFLVCDKRGRI